MDRNHIGMDAEKRALNYLKKQGLKLLTRNYACRVGEIDLIMLDKQHLVFIEVRQRKYNKWGGAASSVDARKQQKLIRTAALFLSQHNRYSTMHCRFDVIAFEADNNTDSGDSFPIWYKDAFRPEATF